MFLSSVINDFLLQVWAMKFTGSTNVWGISVRVTCKSKLNIKKTFTENQGFVLMVMYIVNLLQSEHNRHKLYLTNFVFS